MSEIDPAIPVGSPQLPSNHQGSARFGFTATQSIHYMDATAERLRDGKRAAYAALELAPGDAVLDVGCGPASDLFDLEGIVGPSGRVVGVDASQYMFAEARKRAVARGSRAEIYHARAESLAFPDSTFDAVRAERVFMHIAQPAVAIRELARVTKPGGRVVVIDLDHQMGGVDAADGEFCDRVFRGLLAAALANPRIGRQLRGLFADAGLVNIDVAVKAVGINAWADLQRILGRAADLPALAAGSGLATAEQVRTLLAEFERRDLEGRFFACLVAVWCTGTKTA